MPKTKTKSTVKKRFRTTKRGKILHRRGSVSHRTSKERSSAKSRRRRKKRLKGVEKKRIKRIIR